MQLLTGRPFVGIATFVLVLGAAAPAIAQVAGRGTVDTHAELRQALMHMGTASAIIYRADAKLGFSNVAGRQPVVTAGNALHEKLDTISGANKNGIPDGETDLAKAQTELDAGIAGLNAAARSDVEARRLLPGLPAIARDFTSYRTQYAALLSGAPAAPATGSAGTSTVTVTTTPTKTVPPACARYGLLQKELARVRTSLAGTNDPDAFQRLMSSLDELAARAGTQQRACEAGASGTM